MLLSVAPINSVYSKNSPKNNLNCCVRTNTYQSAPVQQKHLQPSFGFNFLGLFKKNASLRQEAFLEQFGKRIFEVDKNLPKVQELRDEAKKIGISEDFFDALIELVKASKEKGIKFIPTKEQISLAQRALKIGLPADATVKEIKIREIIFEMDLPLDWDEEQVRLAQKAFKSGVPLNKIRSPQFWQEAQPQQELSEALTTVNLDSKKITGLESESAIAKTEALIAELAKPSPPEPPTITKTTLNVEDLM